MSLSRNHWSRQQDVEHNWALVLAAGEGSRLQALTTMPSGLDTDRPGARKDVVRRAS